MYRRAVVAGVARLAAPMAPAAWLVMLAVAGCLGGQDGSQAVGPGSGVAPWTAVPQGEGLLLSLDDLATDDWVLVELLHAQTGTIAAKSDGAWEFENPGVTPELAYACLLFAGGTRGQGAAMGAAPFLVPERLYPGAVEVGPQPEVRVREGAIEAHASARTTGFGYGLGNLLALPGRAGNVSLLAFGLADHARWQDEGAHFELEVGQDTAFHYRVVFRGRMDCRSAFEDYDAGRYVRTSAATTASGLAARFPAADGLVALVSYAGDIVRTVEVTGPTGQQEYENGTSPSTVPRLTVDAESFVLCREEPGAWGVSYPRLEGSDHRLVWGDTLFLDVPPEHHAAFPCTDLEAG